MSEPSASAGGFLKTPRLGEGGVAAASADGVVRLPNSRLFSCGLVALHCGRAVARPLRREAYKAVPLLFRRHSQTTVCLGKARMKPVWNTRDMSHVSHALTVGLASDYRFRSASPVAIAIPRASHAFFYCHRLFCRFFRSSSFFLNRAGQRKSIRPVAATMDMWRTAEAVPFEPS